MTQVHRIVLMVVDHDKLGIDGVIEALETQRYSNHCISPKVAEDDTESVEWSDVHPLNGNRWLSAFRELFK